MKRLFLLMIAIIFIGLFILIPNRLGTAYPPSGPLPPLPDSTSTPSAPQNATPEFIEINCLPTGILVGVGWWQPREDIPPFSFSNPGEVIVNIHGFGYYYPLTYEGKDEYGWHRWYTTTDRFHDGFLIAYVRTLDNFSHYVDPLNQMFTCEDTILYLPLMVR